MKNLQFSDNAKEFFRNNKVRLQSLTAAVIIAGSLVGCGRKDTSVATTPAELYINNSLVITTDTGEKNIVRKIIKNGCDSPFSDEHFHYYDVITGNYYSDNETCLNFINNSRNAFAIYLNITNIESIADYLNAEEITKLMNNELSIEDCVAIVTRIKESSIEEVKTK